MQLERALVTGASVGIGRAIATDLAERGTDLVVVARDEARLKELADELSSAHSIDVEVLPADLTLPEDRARVEHRIADRPSIDCVVNNAGLGTYGDIAGSTADAELRQVEVNVTALLHLTTVASQTFKARRHGAILNVSSCAGFQPNPGHATYGATKAFVTSLSEAVHEELAPFGVHVTALCPGYTRTEFHDRADWSTDGLPDFLWCEAEDVAREGVEGLLDGRALVVPGAQWKALAAMSQVSPSIVGRKVAGMFARSGSHWVAGPTQGSAGAEEDAAVTVHELVGGTDAFLELVDRFYERVESDPPLRAVYPEDLEPGKRRLALFLAQYWGGPTTYSEQRGHPRLRRRHMPFDVTPDGAARWATHMVAAIESMDFPDAAEEAMVAYVRRFAPSMVNTPDP